MRVIRGAFLFIAGLVVGLAVEVALAQNSSPNKGIVGLNHVCIVVPNLDEAVNYYTKTLGFPEAFRSKDDKGNVVHWIGELSSPTTMLAAGMSRTSLKAGDEIEVKGKTGQEGVPAVLIDSIMRNGKMLVGGRDGEKFTSDTR